MTHGNPVTGFIIFLVVIPFLVYRWKTTHFECPTCGCSFKVSFSNYFITRHRFNARYVTCPNCYTTAMMVPIPDRK